MEQEGVLLSLMTMESPLIASWADDAKPGGDTRIVAKLEYVEIPFVE
jgi:hypothetical protein